MTARPAHPRTLAVALLVVVVAACGGDPAIPADVGNAADAADAADTADPPDAAGPETREPLLKRPAASGRDCTLTSVDYGLADSGFSSGSAITATDTGFLMANCQAGDWTTPEAGVRLIPVSMEGLVGAAVDLPVAGQATGECQITSLDNTAVVAWREYPGGDAPEAIRWSSVDSLGGVAKGPTDLTTHQGGYPFRLHRLVAAGGATGWLWTDPDGLRFQLASDAGVPQGTSTLLAARYVSDPRGVSTADGFLFTWTQNSDIAGPEVFALATDHSGTPLGPATRFARAATETLSTRNGDLVAVGDGYLAAVSERIQRGEEPPGGDEWITGPWSTWPDGSLESTVLLQRLDSTGTPVGPLERLQAGVPHIENADPTLAVVGDDVAVVWSKGRVIYVCGGCMRDNNLQLVLLGGTDLTPTSAVVELPPNGVNGLFRPHLAASGSALAATFDQDFHAMTRAGWAHFGCTTL